jgi:phage gpG-like protein
MGIDARGLREALEGLRQFQGHLLDQTQFWDTVKPFLHNVAVRRFRAGSQPPEWPALHYPHPGPMLVQTGKMRDSITEKTNKNGIKQRVGVRYGWYHHVGSRRSLGGYLTQSAAARLIAGGARHEVGTRKRRTKVWTGKGWAYVAQRGGRGRGKKRVLFREQAGRGGLDARPLLFLELDNQQEVLDMLTSYFLQFFGPEALRESA